MQAKKITVTGLVQGVGFRPTVAELAEECGIAGQVKNKGGIVEIIASGEEKAVERFLHRLKRLRVGRIDSLEVQELSEDTWDISKQEVSDGEIKGNFKIVESSEAREAVRCLPVDFPTCERCRAELLDKNNRRYRYPFISCTNCGPRYSIQKAVPYDRNHITMDDFDMCPECFKEYNEKGNIRRHAQTIACHNCGPVLKLITKDLNIDSGVARKATTEEAAEWYECSDDTEWILETAIQALREQKIVAVKDIGGFHFAFSPMSQEAAKRLREFKHRDKKPFAVMFPNMDAIREFCEVSEKEEALLCSQARPIVLLKKKKDFVPEICGESDRIGALLPCNPLQILLIEEVGPLVMTSGNRGGEPIIIRDEEMRKLMEEGCPDMILTHDREILTPLDDSIYQVNGRFVQLIRRARGLVPEAITLRQALKQDIFAAGGDLKATFVLGHGKMAYLSQYFGDLEDVRCMKERSKAVFQMEQLLEVKPKVTVGDMHPAYISTQGMNRKIQHHMAHVASVIAEHQLEGRVLGIACDGTGYGTDGTIWGSEFFRYDECAPEKMERVGHFWSVKLLGGDASAKDADKILFSYIMEAKERGFDVCEMERVLYEAEAKTEVENTSANQKKMQYQLQEMAWKQNINTVRSSSMGRLFDAASALLDICHYNSYEGQCAIMLEQAAHKGMEQFWNQQKVGQEADLKMRVAEQDGMWIADSVGLLMALAELKRQYAGKENGKEILAYLFHHAVAKAIISMAELMGKEYTKVALSGGSFINRILLAEVTHGLEKNVKVVYTNEKVPCGDGGIALGQVWLASLEESS